MLIARGLSNTEIGGELYISEFGLHDRVQAVVLAYETGLFDTNARPPGNHGEMPTR
jgi:DNA-binding NarL/FixJ family response regulator